MSPLKSTGGYRHTADVGELQKEFILVDRDHDGRVNFDEFKQLMEGLDSGMTHDEMEVGFHEVDTNRDGLIDCREFIDWWSND
jgi:Ca2+-binding EF-hand superfamily protein